MDLSRWIVGKAQTTPSKFLGSEIRLIDTANKLGKDRPFNYSTAVNQYRGWMYAAMWLNARTLATVPLKLYMRRRGGKDKLFATRQVRNEAARYINGRHKYKPSEYVLNKASEWGEDYEEVTEKHPITDLLSHPNPWMMGFEFSAMRSLFMQLTGNFFMHPVMERATVNEQALNRIKQLWVMPSQWMKIVPGTPESQELVSEYIFGVDQSVAKHFSPDEVMHCRQPNPRNIWYGLGQMEAAWDVQKLSIAQRETDQSRYDNLARPDLAVITKSANGTIEQLKELQEEWARLFRGTFRQGNPVFLTGDTQVIPLNWMPAEQGDKERVIEEIAAISGVPVSLLLANDPNLASAQVGFASWRENTILPYCRMDEEFLNEKILPVYGLQDDAFLCYENPVPENRDELRQDVMGLVGKVWTINEGRAKLGDNPLDDENADKLLVPSGQVLLEDAGDPTFGMSSGGGFTMSDPSRSPKDSNKEDDDAVPRAGKSQKHFQPVPCVRQSDHMYERHKADAADDVRDGEKEKPIRNMQAALNSVFEQQRRAAVRACYGRKADVSLEEIISAILGFDKQIADAVAPFMAQQLMNGGHQGMADIHLPEDTFSITNPKVAQFMHDYTIRLAGEINGYTTEKLAQTLAEGFDEGESTSQLARRVNALYDDFSGYRSEMIARTESARAFVAGTEQAWRESGIVTGKKWELAPGACEVCQAVAAQFANTQVALNEPFYPLGSVIRLPGGKAFKVDYSAVMGPPVHPHDRCGITAVVMEQNV